MMMTQGKILKIQWKNLTECECKEFGKEWLVEPSGGETTGQKHRAQGKKVQGKKTPSKFTRVWHDL